MKYCVETDSQVFRAKNGSIVSFACAIEALKEAASRRYFGDIYNVANNGGGLSAARVLQADHDRVLKAIEVVKRYLKV